MSLANKFCAHCGKPLRNKKSDAIHCNKCRDKSKQKSSSEINKGVNKVKKKTRLMKSLAEKEEVLDELAEEIASRSNTEELHPNILFPTRLGRLMSRQLKQGESMKDSSTSSSTSP